MFVERLLILYVDEIRSGGSTHMEQQTGSTLNLEHPRRGKSQPGPAPSEVPRGRGAWAVE